MTIDPKNVSWAEDSYDERPMRVCLACGKKDRAPRDVVTLPDGNAAPYHKDCHALMGCAVCEEELKVVAGGHGAKGKKNEDLWLAILEAADPKTGDTPDVYTRDDVTGDYQKTLEAGNMVDDNWEVAK